MNISDIDDNMTQDYRYCDYLTGKNDDGIKYDYCSECYRYNICKKNYEEEKLKKTTVGRA